MGDSTNSDSGIRQNGAHEGEHEKQNGRVPSEEGSILPQGEKESGLTTGCPVFIARHYRLAGGSTLVVLKLHCVVLDRVSVVLLCGTVFASLAHLLLGTPLPEGKEQWEPRDVRCTEDMIPRHLKDKPFWAHGLDMLGEYCRVRAAKW